MLYDYDWYVFITISISLVASYFVCFSVFGLYFTILITFVADSVHALN